tara:strand:+ start:1280 stop:2485 length:1206 start_codon:yes stop_codon:yes gene_type:complete
MIQHYILLIVSPFTFIGMAFIYFLVAKSLRKNFYLKKNIALEKSDSSLTIVIPTYNEQNNIERCLKSIFNSFPPCDDWNVFLVDDSSTDQTIKLAEKLYLKNTNIKCNFKIFSSGERPRDCKWVGKNWPCTFVTDKITSSWVLFLDADTSLDPYALIDSIHYAENNNIDLLSLAPRIKCTCFAEWIVQPIMAILLPIGFPIKSINDQSNSLAFAAGPFMFFNKSAYDFVGGHRAISGEVVEDIALAKRIKSSGLKLEFLLGINSLELKMYDDISALLEGWTKNFYIALNKSIIKSIFLSIVVFSLFSMPWFIIILILKLLIYNDIQSFVMFVLFIFQALTIILQYNLRLYLSRKARLSTKYWWLMGLGGVLVSLLAPISIFKTLTGISWTWKGRHLANNKN